MKKAPISRRDLIKKALTAGGTLGILGSTAAWADTCLITPKQGQGPFYPEGDIDRDTDLTRISSSDPKAEGEIIQIRGKVTDRQCRAIEGAEVEIWQACATGRYNHSEDGNDLALDPNFQYWGRAITDSEGRYGFKTIIPGHYPLNVVTGRYRPPHIHFKIRGTGILTLTTQMYFSPKSYDDPMLAKLVDRLNRLESVNPWLIVEFKRLQLESEIKRGIFDIVVARA